MGQVTCVGDAFMGVVVRTQKWTNYQVTRLAQRILEDRSVLAVSCRRYIPRLLALLVLVSTVRVRVWSVAEPHCVACQSSKWFSLIVR